MPDDSIPLCPSVSLCNRIAHKDLMGYVVEIAINLGTDSCHGADL